MAISTTVGYTVEASGTVDEVVASLTRQLKNRGFGVLSNINLSKIIKEKLDANIDSYAVLDVCNPRQAKKALDAHKDVGLVLPCKIIVYIDSGKVWVSLYKPTEAIKVLNYEDLKPLAEEVERDLEAAVDAVAI